MFEIFLRVVLVLLMTPLSLALLATILQPRRTDDILKRMVGDAPPLRGGYASMPGNGKPQ